MTSAATSALKQDLTGYPLTCRSEAALQSFNEGVLSYVSFRENGLPYISKALDLDDSIVLAHCLMVREGDADHVSKQCLIDNVVMYFIGFCTDVRIEGSYECSR